MWGSAAPYAWRRTGERLPLSLVQPVRLQLALLDPQVPRESGDSRLANVRQDPLPLLLAELVAGFSVRGDNGQDDHHEDVESD
jgi:hypothetical protein